MFGHPFVGPAGQLLDSALAELGIVREQLHVTNTVKHFKFEARGERRLHMRANAAEQAACRIWLDAELLHLKPKRIVCLCAMAAPAIFGRAFRLMRKRGEWIDLADGTRAMAPMHPSWLLCRRGDEERERAHAGFAHDLARLQE